MMASGMQARPTEYKGIVFRSKSEAIFGRCLDLLALRRLRDGVLLDWCYEPDFRAIGIDRKYDFLIRESSVNTLWDNRLYLIEYKPSQPTATYLLDWEVECQKHQSIFGSLRMPHIQCWLFAFNFYERSGSHFVENCTIGADGNERARDFFFDVVGLCGEAKKYRFDLKG